MSTCNCHGHWWPLDSSERFRAVHDELGCSAIRDAVVHVGDGDGDLVIAALETLARADPLGRDTATSWLSDGAPLDETGPITSTAVVPLADVARSTRHSD